MKEDRLQQAVADSPADLQREHSPMPRLFIPTRNRPTSLRSVLTFLDHFYPGTGVIIADGSNESYKPLNRETVAGAAPSLAIDYRPYPADLCYFARIVDVLRNVNDELLVVGSDDDFPMMEVFQQGARFLRENTDFVTAMGATVNLNLKNSEQVIGRLSVARGIQSDSPVARARGYAQWPVATTYAVTRRDLLLERYQRAQQLFLAGLYDYSVGLHDALRGKIKAIPKIAFISTRNYNHSYLRPESVLFFIHDSELVLKIAGFLKQDLLEVSSLDSSAAEKLTESLMLRIIAERCGTPAHLRSDFAESPMYSHKAIQQQLTLFSDLFTDGTDTRRRYRKKLAFIAEALRRNAISSDNRGEPGHYDRPEDQLVEDKASADAASPTEPPPHNRLRKLPGESIGIMINVEAETLLRVDAPAPGDADVR